MSFEAGKDQNNLGKLTQIEPGGFLEATKIETIFGREPSQEDYENYVEDLYKTAPEETEAADLASKKIEETLLAFAPPGAVPPSPKAAPKAAAEWSVPEKYTHQYYQDKGRLPEWYNLDFRATLFEEAFGEFLDRHGPSKAEMRESLEVLNKPEYPFTKFNIGRQVPMAKIFMKDYPGLSFSGFRGDSYKKLIPIMTAALEAKLGVKPKPVVAPVVIDYSTKTPDQLRKIMKGRVDEFLALDDEIENRSDRQKVEQLRAKFGATMSANDFQNYVAVHVTGSGESDRVKPLKVGEIPTEYFCSVHNALSNHPSNVYSYLIQTHCKIKKDGTDPSKQVFEFYFPLTKPLSECQKVEVKWGEIKSRGFITSIEDNARYRSVPTGPTAVRDFYTTSNSSDARLLVPKALEIAYMKAFRPRFAASNSKRNDTSPVNWSAAVGGRSSEVIVNLLGNDYVDRFDSRRGTIDLNEKKVLESMDKMRK